MKYFFTKLRQRFGRLLSVVLVFGVTALVLAYFLGFYDISFIDRAELLGSIGTPTATTAPEASPETGTAADTHPGGETVPSTDTEAAEKPEDTSAPAGDTVNKPAAPQKESKSVLDITNTDLLSDKPKAISSVDSYLKRGYGQTTADWTDDMRLGKMKFAYSLPKKYSVSTHTVEKPQVVYPENFSEYTVSMVPVTEERPAIGLYMGYILYDKGTELLFIGPDGTVLFAFDDTVTIPAYMRDKNGLPLFYRWGWDEGERVKEYYRLSDDGKTFIVSDYDPVLHDRGLAYDYPAWYGLSDNESIVRMQEGEEMVSARLLEEEERLAALTEEEILAEEEERKLNKTVVFNAYPDKRIAYYKYGTDMTGYKFRQAYNFHAGFAAAVGDENRQEMVFLTETGRRALSGHKMYYKADYERYVIESWRLPASFGLESIGSLYFDHGLVRVRKQAIDNYAYMTYDNIRVISDTEILVDRSGNEFPIPSGYVLKGYSNGMLLLEKDGRYGFMDYTGDWIAEPVYANATPFINNLATLTTADGRVGMIDTKGNIVLPFAYQSISQASSGLIAAYHKEQGWSVLQILGK